MKLICLLLGLVALSQADIEWSNVQHMNFHVKPPKKFPFRPPVVHRPSIVNGNEAGPHQFPYQVGVFATAPEGTYFCGGSLISKKYVMSAGHCADGMLNFTLVIGAHHIREPDSGSVSLQSSKSVVHPDYDAYSIVNDISIIELPEEVELSDAIQPVKLPSRSQASDLFIGANSTISGWGLTHDSDYDISPILRYVSNPVLSNQDCSTHMGDVNIPETQICQSGDGNKGACNGDSGGPLTVPTDDGNRIQVGLTSYGLIFGCEAGYATAYTRITSYLDFIEENSDVTIDP